MSTEYALDKNIPVPEKSRSPDNKKKYPWHKMEIGDSFLCQKHPLELSRAAERVQARCEKKWTVRSTKEGTRVWRIA